MNSAAKTVSFVGVADPSSSQRTTQHVRRRSAPDNEMDGEDGFQESYSLLSPVRVLRSLKEPARPTRIYKALLVILFATVALLTTYIILTETTHYRSRFRHGRRPRPIHSPLYRPGAPNNRKAVVMASTQSQDSAWHDQIPDDWEVWRYVMDDAHPFHDLTVPRNQGREAMAYLTFIIDNYHHLPNYTVFSHGHLRAWHQPEPFPMKLKSLNLTVLSQENYINFRCADKPGCTDQSYFNIQEMKPEEDRIAGKLLPGYWRAIFPELPAPERLNTKCCAQFAVTREAILARPLDWWIAMRKPMTRDLSEYRGVWADAAIGVDSYAMGMIFEMTWHVIFGKPAQWCPSEDTCRGIHFSDGSRCSWYTGKWIDAKGWENITCWETGKVDYLGSSSKTIRGSRWRPRLRPT